jgi:CRISPR-associated protein Csb2
MAFADVRTMSAADVYMLPGVRWYPNPGVKRGEGMLRVPTNDETLQESTLADLKNCHQTTLERIRSGEPLHSRDQPRVFDCVFYSTIDHPVSRPYLAFCLLKPDLCDYLAVNSARHYREVAAWVRNATARVCRDGWPFGDIAGFVHGHDKNGNQLKGDGADRRFMYLPLPTINHALNRVESIRRVLLVAPAACQAQLDWAKRRLPGQELHDLVGNVVGLLSIMPTTDWVLQQYVGESQEWSTVTPVIWPGHDDHDSKKAEKLLRRAFVQAGLSQEVVDSIEDLDWRFVGYRAGLDLAGTYLRPDKPKGRAYHVWVRFKHRVRGPIAVGAGRYRGFGLFAVHK